MMTQYINNSAYFTAVQEVQTIIVTANTGLTQNGTNVYKWPKRQTQNNLHTDVQQPMQWNG